MFHRNFHHKKKENNAVKELAFLKKHYSEFYDKIHGGESSVLKRILNKKKMRKEIALLKE